MTTLREAAQRALNKFDSMNHEDSIFAGEFEEIITALRAALAEPEQDPVAYLTADGERVVTAKTYEGARRDGGAMWSTMRPYVVRLFKHPAPQPVELTDEEIENIALNLADAEIGRALKGEETNFSVEFARAVIEAYQCKQEGKV